MIPNYIAGAVLSLLSFVIVPLMCAAGAIVCFCLGSQASGGIAKKNYNVENELN
jgi:hypothetical protein